MSITEQKLNSAEDLVNAAIGELESILQIADSEAWYEDDKQPLMQALRVARELSARVTVDWGDDD